MMYSHIISQHAMSSSVQEQNRNQPNSPLDHRGLPRIPFDGFDPRGFPMGFDPRGLPKPFDGLDHRGLPKVPFEVPNNINQHKIPFQGIDPRCTPGIEQNRIIGSDQRCTPGIEQNRIIGSDQRCTPGIEQNRILGSDQRSSPNLPYEETDFAQRNHTKIPSFDGMDNRTPPKVPNFDLVAPKVPNFDGIDNKPTKCPDFEGIDNRTPPKVPNFDSVDNRMPSNSKTNFEGQQQHRTPPKAAFDGLNGPGPNFKFFSNDEDGESEKKKEPESPTQESRQAQRGQIDFANFKPRQVVYCSKCDYQTFHKHALERHISAVHDKLKFYHCDECDYKTGHASALKRHVSKIHDRESQSVYSCEECKYSTVHKSALKRHFANKHEKETLVQHKCSVCAYSTTYEFALERHISTVHLKEGAYECRYCEYETVHKHALDRHVKMVHDKPENIHCEADNCTYKTAYKSALKMHHAVVHEARETFHCPKCEYETLYKTALQRHMQTVLCGTNHAIDHNSQQSLPSSSGTFKKEENQVNVFPMYPYKEDSEYNEEIAREEDQEVVGLDEGQAEKTNDDENTNEKEEKVPPLVVQLQGGEPKVAKYEPMYSP